MISPVWRHFLAKRRSLVELQRSLADGKNHRNCDSVKELVALHWQVQASVSTPSAKGGAFWGALEGLLGASECKHACGEESVTLRWRVQASASTASTKGKHLGALLKAP